MNNKLKVGSDFSGCGALIKALLRLELNFKEIFACDCDHNQANPKKKISETQLYKMAGNSIVVQCLVNIIKNLKLD